MPAHCVPIELRLHARCEKVTESGCWIWMGACSLNGYGLIGISKGPKKNHLGRVHRVAYELYRGPIPKGMQLDHLCRVRCCANPWHCEIVDNRTNILRGIGPTSINAKKTHCKNGHPFVRIGRQGRRMCNGCS